jgi:hypothetical protein
MPTINGLRRRGYPASAIHKFCELIGVTRNQTVIRVELLEHCCRYAISSCTCQLWRLLIQLSILRVKSGCMVEVFILSKRSTWFFSSSTLCCVAAIEGKYKDIMMKRSKLTLSRYWSLIILMGKRNGYLHLIFRTWKTRQLGNCPFQMYCIQTFSLESI